MLGDSAESAGLAQTLMAAPPYPTPAGRWREWLSREFRGQKPELYLSSPTFSYVIFLTVV
jgi:hypothetical protein